MIKLLFLLSLIFTLCVNVTVAFVGLFRGTAISRPLSRVAASATILQSGNEEERSTVLSSAFHDLAWEEISIAQQQQQQETSNSPRKRTTTSSTGDDHPSLTTAATEAERIQQGQSVIVLHNIVSPQECRDLAERCIQTAQDVHRSELEHHTSTTSNEQPTLVRMPCQAAARRATWDKITCANPLPDYIDYRVQQILQSVCQAIDANLPSLPQQLFDTRSLKQLLNESSSSANPNEDALVFSAREPAINVYSAPGGEFLPHKDGETLTVLLPLSSPGSDFQGGGTAFWSGGVDAAASSSSAGSGSGVTLKPVAGTALLFGGSVTHAGLPVTEGKRVVLVCSLSRRNVVAKEGDEHEGAFENNNYYYYYDDDDDLRALLQSAAADWHDKWTSSGLRDSCPDM